MVLRLVQWSALLGTIISLWTLPSKQSFRYEPFPLCAMNPSLFAQPVTTCHWAPPKVENHQIESVQKLAHTPNTRLTWNSWSILLWFLAFLGRKRSKKTIGTTKHRRSLSQKDKRLPKRKKLKRPWLSVTGGELSSQQKSALVSITDSSSENS